MKLTLGVDSVFEERLEEMKWFLAFALLDELFEIMGFLECKIMIFAWIRKRFLINKEYKS